MPRQRVTTPTASTEIADPQVVSSDAIKLGDAFATASQSVRADFERWLNDLEGLRLQPEAAAQVVHAVMYAARRGGMELLFEGTPAMLVPNPQATRKFAKIQIYTRGQKPSRHLRSTTVFPHLDVRPCDAPLDVAAE